MSGNENEQAKEAEEHHSGNSTGDNMEDMMDLDAEFERLEKEKRELAQERDRLEALRYQLEKEKKALRERETGERSASADAVMDKEKLEEEKKRLEEEWKELKEERKKLDILFEEIASRRYALEQEERKIRKIRAELDDKENALKEREETLKMEREAFERERAEWHEEYEKQMEEIRRLPELKTELELERENLRLERLRIEEERKLLEDERKMLDNRRKMMDEEREILENQRRLLEEQKRRILETGGITSEIRKALETQPSKLKLKEEPAAPPEIYDVERVSEEVMARTIDAESEEDRKRRERLKELEKKIHSKTEEEKKLPTMTCLSCGTPIPLPVDAGVVKCPHCGREYKVRGRGKPKTGARKIEERATKRIKVARSQVTEHPAPDIPIPYTSVPPTTPRHEAVPYERDGHYYILCQNPACNNEIELLNPHARRVQCPVCGRRNKVAPVEES